MVILPLIFQKSIVAGETFVLNFQDCGYFAPVTVAIRGASSADIVAESSDSGGGKRWTARVDSTGWLPGNYQFEIMASKNEDGDRGFIARDAFTVSASITDVQTDTRSLAQRNVDALEAYLSSIGDPDADASVLRYKIKDRELFNYPISEIQQLLGYWRRRLIREQREALGLRGRPGIRIFL